MNQYRSWARVELRKSTDRISRLPLQNRFPTILLFAQAVLILGITAVGQSVMLADDHNTVRESRPNSWRNDARLNDIFFLDPQRGWAVGEQGTILRTTDSGKNWQEISKIKLSFTKDKMQLNEKVQNLQAGRSTNTTGVMGAQVIDKPIRCQFHSVHFVDENHGWVAGGYYLPYINRSKAVVMRTEDGGVTWQSVDGTMIPSIRKIRFQSLKHGWAIGDSSNLSAAAIFYTSNGGKSWSTRSVERSNGWIDAVSTERGLLVIDPKGRIGHFRQNKYEPAILIGDQTASFSKLKMTDQKTGFAVGKAGVLAQTTDGGRSWNQIPWNADFDWMTEVDIASMAIHQDQLWFAGNPGSSIISINLKSGKTTTHRLPVTSAIQQIKFVDEKHGWAVGDSGVILQTTNGGQSWNLQRGKNLNVAILFVAPSPRRLPLSLLARYCTEENRYCSTLLMAGSPREACIANQAITRLGCASLITISNIQERKLSNLVRTIRSLRPKVIVCTSSESNPDEDANVLRQLRTAIRMAADNKAFPYQLSELHLSTHQVSRLSVQDVAGELTVNPRRLLARTGAVIEEKIALSRALCGLPVITTTPPRYRMISIANSVPLQGDNLLAGLSGIKLVSRNDRSTRGNLSNIRKSAEKTRRMQEFANFAVHRPRDVVVWRRQIEKYVVQFEPQEASSWMMQLTERYLQLGKLELAAQSAQLLASRWPDSPYALAALVWLTRYYGSDEMGRIAFDQRIRRGQIDASGAQSKASRIANKYSTAPKEFGSQGSSQLVWTPIQANSLDTQRKPEKPDLDLISNEEETKVGLPAFRPTFFQKRLKLAAKMLSTVTQRDPDVAATPYCQWLEAQLARRLGGLSTIQGTTRIRRYQRLTESSKTGFSFEKSMNESIGTVAHRELKLEEYLKQLTTKSTHGTSPIESSITVAKKTESKPKLDGKLNDPCWLRAPSYYSKKTDAGRFLMKVCFDEEYLYVGVVCQKIAGADYRFENRARPRDADLDRRDRIALQVDIDRDYDSSFRFEMDHRGWVRDVSSGMVNWNPTWFVSQSETDLSWMIEAAIPVEHVSPNQLKDGTVWSMKVDRLTKPVAKNGLSQFQFQPVKAKNFGYLRLGDQLAD